MVNIGANIGDFKQGTNEVKGTLKSLVSDVAAISITAFAGIAAAMAPVSVYAIKLSSDMQQARISMETMLGSADKATQMIGDLQKFAAETPFEFSELQTATKRMLAFGFAADDIIPSLTAIGDAGAGLGIGAEGVNRLTLALGQMKAKGKVSGDEMLQMTEAGIPAWDILSKSIGKSTAEVMELAEKGVLPADQAIQALLAGMEERFPHMMDKQSKSMAGMFSTLKDNISIALIEVAKPAVAWLTDVGLPKLIEMTSNFANTMKNGGSLTEAFNSMFSGGFDSVLAEMGTVGEYLRDIGNAIAWVKDNANMLIPVLAGLAGAFVGLQIIQSVLGPLEAFVVTGIVVVGVIMAMATYMGYLSVVSTITPIFMQLIAVLKGLGAASFCIGGITIAISLLAAAAYLIYDNWEPIKIWFIELWNEIVNFVSDNILVLCALFPVLGVAAYAIYEYWDYAVQLAKDIMVDLANEVAWIKSVILNEFSYYSKMWDDFVGEAEKGINDFKNELSNLASSFMPAWASSMLGGIQSLGEKLAAKTAEIGAAMRKNLTVVPKNFSNIPDGVAYGPQNQEQQLEQQINPPPATIRPADWSKADFSGGKDNKKGKSDEEKAAEKTEREWEQLQKKAEQTSESIKKEWISLTGTQIDALDNWKADELKTLDESAAANENYQRDLSRLNEIYAEKKKKILADEQKDINRIWDSAKADAQEYQNKLVEIGVTGVDKQKIDIDQGASAEIDKMLAKYRDLKAEFENSTKEQQEQFKNAWIANGIQFEVAENGMVSFQKQIAANQIIIEKEKQQKIQDLHYDTQKFIDNLGKAKDVGNISAYIAELNSERAALSQDLAGRQELIDAYYSNWKETHRTSMSYMAEGMTSFQSGMADIFQNIGKDITSVGDLFKSFGSMVINTILKMQAQAAAASITSSLFGDLFSGGIGGGSSGLEGRGANVHNSAISSLSMIPKNLFGFASGGILSGPGTGTSDSMLIRASNGEGILTASAVKMVGSDFINSLNKGKIPGFATGGTIGGIVTGSSLSSVSGNYSSTSAGASTNSSNPPGIKVNINNYGNANVQAENPQYDAQSKSWVLNVVIDGLKNNSSIRSAVKGAAR